MITVTKQRKYDSTNHYLRTSRTTFCGREANPLHGWHNKNSNTPLNPDLDCKRCIKLAWAALAFPDPDVENYDWIDLS